EVRGLDLGEAGSKRIDPECVGEFGVADGDVSGHSLGEAKRGKDAEAAGESLFPVLPLVGEGAECRRRELLENGGIGVLFGLGEFSSNVGGIQRAHASSPSLLECLG